MLKKVFFVLFSFLFLPVLVDCWATGRSSGRRWPGERASSVRRGSPGRTSHRTWQSWCGASQWGSPARWPSRSPMIPFGLLREGERGKNNTKLEIEKICCKEKVNKCTQEERKKKKRRQQKRWQLKYFFFPFSVSLIASHLSSLDLHLMTAASTHSYRAGKRLLKIKPCRQNEMRWDEKKDAHFFLSIQSSTHRLSCFP